MCLTFPSFTSIMFFGLVAGFVKGFLSVELDVHPSNVELIATGATAGRCYASCLTSEGGILIGSARGLIKIPDISSLQQKEDIIVGNEITSVLPSEDGKSWFYLHELNDKDRSLHELTVSDKNRRTIFDYSLTPPVGSKYIALTLNHYVVTAVDRLYVYHTTQKTLNYQNMCHSTRNVVGIPGTDTFLVTGNSSLFKYEINDGGGLQEVWKCTGLKEARGVCLMENGSSIVLSWTEKVLFIVSKEG